MIIDFHTHTFPEKIAQRAISSMQASSHAAAFSDGTSAALKASMADAGITYSVVLPVATNPTKLASMNDFSIENNGADGLIYFGAMHPLADNWEEELSRLAAAGIKGIKIHPLYQEVDIDDIRYLRILEKAAELGLITVMHAGADIGFPGIDRCPPEAIRQAVNQLGNIPLVLAHMGGWKNWDRVTDQLASTCVYIDTSFSLGSIPPLDDGYYSPNQLPLLSSETFCKLIRDFGAHRVLFGTDSPWACQKSEVNAIRNLPLTTQEQTQILGENARKLLHI